ncbi:hypothetical protein J1N44_12590 [Acidovorax temperans]|uniref:hypothetical protein n=1 Tax=Acidovorax temperans TaxID=80878 RepID=UPI001A94F8A5|nr:hypothetical protein [Acidovorax temperans]MBO0942519.1 hypothetical protein [Acidovorax temperans]
MAWFSCTKALPAGTVAVSARKRWMKSSCSGWTGVNAPVRRSLQALQAGGQAEVGRVAFMVAPF